MLSLACQRYQPSDFAFCISVRSAAKAQLEISTKEGQRFHLRLLRCLSIKKSSSLFPLLIAATSHFGFAPRPAHVSPFGPRYLGLIFLPFNALPCRPRRILSPPSKVIALSILASCFCNSTRWSRSL